MDALQNKVAIVTGASSGIGHATAILFAREGAKLVLTARRQTELDTLVAEIQRAGGQAIAVAGDVKDEAVAERVVETALERLGRFQRLTTPPPPISPVVPRQALV